MDTFVIRNEALENTPPTPQQPETFHQVHKRNGRGTLTSLPGCPHKERGRKTDKNGLQKEF